MDPKPSHFAVAAISSALLACSALSEKWSQCPLPPEGFSEEQLAGTWVATRLDFVTDTLIIREDYMYRQSLHMTSPSFDYEGDWLNWYIEENDYGLPYLHLEGLRLYGYLPALMNKDQLGGGDAWFVNFCEPPSHLPDGHEVFPGVQMPPNEAILVAMGRPSTAVLSPEVVLAVLPVTDILGWTYLPQD